jgi:hypothetical protein
MSFEPAAEDPEGVGDAVDDEHVAGQRQELAVGLALPGVPRGSVSGLR